MTFPLLALVATFCLAGEPAPAAREISAFGGAILLPLPPSWRASRGADGWLLIEGPRFSLSLKADPFQLREGLKPRVRDVLAHGLALERHCSPGRPMEEPLANGWHVLYEELSCPAPDGTALTHLTGALADPSLSLFVLTAQYPDPSQKAAILSWLSRARRRSSPPRRFPVPLAAAALAAGVLAAALGSRPPGPIAASPAPTRSGSLFPMEVRESFSPLGRRLWVLDRIGRRHAVVCRHWPTTLLHGGFALAAASAAGAFAGLLAGLPLRPSALIYGGARGVLVGAGAAVLGALASPLGPRRLRLLDEDGTFLLEVRRRSPLRPSSPYVVRSPAGAELAFLRRHGTPLARKRWILQDSRGETLLSLSEASALKSVLRRLLGHLWGPLRSELILRTPDGVVGAVQRAGPLRGRLRILLDPQAERRLDVRVVIAAALFVEFRDPDHWHPWPV